MKQLMISLALFVYGTAALAYNTVIVNDTDYRVNIRYYDDAMAINACREHGHNNVQCVQNRNTAILLPHRALNITDSDKIYLETVSFQNYPQMIFRFEEVLRPFEQLDRRANDNQHNDLVVLPMKKRHDVILELKLIELQDGNYKLYLEEPRLFRNKNMQGYPHPINSVT